MIEKKILIILQDGVGGAERISVLIGKNLPPIKYKVVFCVIDRNSKTTIEDFIPNGYPIIRLPNASPLKMMCQLYRLVRRERPHVVFSTAMYLNTKILPFRSLFPDMRFVIRCENYLYTFNKRQHWQIRLTYHLADAIIVQTREMGDELTEQMKIKEDKVYVINNPVDVELINRMVAESENPYPHNGKKHFVASGRFAHQKGFDLLFEAYLKVREEYNDVDLYIVGDQYYEEGRVLEYLIKRIKDENVEGLVHFLGYQKNPYPFIRFADSFVLSSRWEGLPNVMIEALYLGTPVAAFKCIPVVERIIYDGVNGFLAEKDDIDELALAMLNSLSLGRVKSTYQSGSINEFINAFLGGAK